MIKKLKIASLMAALLVSAGAQAGPFWFDADGAGAANAIRINSYFDFVGQLDVTNTYTGPLSFNFVQTGAGSFAGWDGVSTFFQGVSPATQLALGQVGFALTGPGNGTLGNSISFTGGTVTFYSPYASNQIAQFNITGGGAAINSVGGVNGASVVDTKIVSASAGYFFKDNSGVQGADITTLSLSDFSDIDGMVLSNLFIQRSTVDQFGRPLTLHFGANGQSVIDIPEPASLALIGLGLLGAGALRRRRRQES